MRDRKIILLLILIMTTVSLTVAGTAITVLYQTAMAEERARLVETAQSQARLLEAVARFGGAHSAHDHPGGSRGATLSQIADAHEHYEGFGQTGEFTLARRDGPDMVFLLSHRHGDRGSPTPVPFNSQLAEPMRRSLSNLSGTVVGPDYRGVTVLAAHEPVHEPTADLHWGIVAKIDLAEVRAPFVRAGAITACAGLVVVLTGATLFLWVSNPLVRRIVESETRTRAIVETAADGLITINDRGMIGSFNRAAEHMFGVAREEVIGGSLSQLIPSLDVVEREESPVARLQSVRDKPGGPVQEAVGHRKNGRHFPVELAISDAYQADQRMRVVAVRDFTERKRAEEALRDAHHELERRVAERTAELTEANEHLKREIAERRRVEEALRLEDARLGALVKLNDMAEASLQQMADFALEEAVKVTNSKMGFLGFLNDAESEMTIHNWTEGAMGDCAIVGRPTVFRIADAGLWGEAVRQRNPIVLNDYPGLKTGKKGYPEGHVPISRFLGIPVFDGERIVAVAAVANKEDEYQEGDIRQLTLLISGMWRLIVRERAEAALRESRRFLQTVIDGMPDPLLVVDRDHRVVLANRVVREMAGADDPVAASLACYQVSHHREAPCDEAERPCPLRNVIAAKAPVRVTHSHFDAEGREHIVEVIAAPIFDETGEVVQVIESCRDITERKRAEEALWESERRFRAIFDQTFQFIGLMTPDGTLIEANRSALSFAGIEEVDVLGKPFWETPWWTHSPELQSRLRAAVRRAAGGDFVRLEVTHPAADGSLHHVDFSLKPVTDETGNVVLLIPEGHDITERRQLERALLEIGRREQQRIGQDLHDVVGQHLTGVAFLTKALEKKLAERGMPEAADASQIAQMINETIMQSRGLARGLCPVDLTAEGLMTALGEYAGYVEKLFDIACTFRCDEPVLVHDDSVAMHLYRITQEAVNNAVRHGQAQKIEITMAASEGSPKLTVTDDGVGLPDEPAPSEGMGLRIMNYRARMTGGALDVRRGRVGGTVVTYFFPLNAAARE